MRLLLAACLIATPVFAEGWMRRDSDQSIDKPALDARLRGEVIEFYDGGRSEYYEDGRYTYTYANDGGTGYGYFEIKDDGSICIEFVTGFSRCDLYVLDAQDRLVVITEKGDRFPVRSDS